MYLSNDLYKLQTTTTTRTRTNETDYHTSSSFSYYPNGLLQQQISEPGDAKQVFTNYTYDSFGNITQVKTSPDGANGRVSNLQYDPKGRMVTQRSNILGHYINYTNDYGLGVVTQAQDNNSLTTTYQYDKFGRLMQTTNPDGTSSSTALNWVTDSNTPQYSVYYSTTQVSGNPAVTSYFNRLGRQIHSETTGFDGRKLITETQYNAKGQVDYVTLPYYDGDSNSDRKSYTYDELGRILTETAPGVSLSYIYDGLSTTVTNVLTGQNTTKTADASGCLIQNTDAGGSITYTYNAMGQVRQVISPSGTNQIGYDQFGHQTSLSDSNAGNMTYDYNVYGELTLQTDALNNSTSLTYDDIGRVYNRNENSLTTNWVYNSNGRLDNETTSSGITYTYTYDTKGRPSNIKETESNVFRTDFNTSYAYNDNGQISKVTYPSGFAVDYHYTNGYLDEIIRDDNQASIWKLNSVNARGQITSSTAGNGMVTSKAYDDRGYLQSIVTTNSSSTVQDLAYSFSAKGYLEWRKDNRHNGITESFGYDNLGRLETINTNGTVVEMTYAANGNIGSKSDAGTYAYSAEHPNAVETLTGNNGTVSDQEQDITYTLFNMPSVITEGSNSATFTYGPEHERKIMSTSVSGGLTKYYSGNYERQDASGATRELNYIVAYGQIVGIFEKKSSGETNMYYVHTDHLSSLNVITDASGNIAQETSYDAWGNRRDPATLQNLTTPPANLITDRGFTGQEHMDAFGLINMNGRIYDPVLGRFLSPDPIVADPTSTQDYNRYSYCGNSPLMYTDPSGYIKATQYRGIIGVGGGGGGWGLGFDWWMNEDDFLFPKMGTLNSPRNTLEYDTQLGQNIANETGDISYLNSVRDGVAMGDYNGRGTISYSGFNGVYFGKTGKIYLDYNFASTPDAITGGFSEDNEKYTIAPGVGVGRMAIDPSIFGNAQSQGGGHSFMDYLNFGVNAGDLYYSVKGEALHNELYWVQKNGTIRSTNSIGNNYLLRRSYNITGELAEGAKIAARNFAYVGTAMSGINMVTDFRFANTFDFAMGLTTFIPGVGWAISGLYFISNVAVQAYTGKTIGEHLEMQINKIGQ